MLYTTALSAVCDYGISWSYSLTIFKIFLSSSEDHSEEYVSDETTSSFFESFVKLLECHSQINQSNT